MTSPRKLTPFRTSLTIDGVDLELDGLRRDGDGPPLVFLHGFGSTKEDFADVIHQRALDDRAVLAYDAPGCGASSCTDLSAVGIPFLVQVAAAVLQAHSLSRYYLIGHSMGGLTALMLAHQHPEQVAGFINIEGNVAPEDCFLSRQIISHPHTDPHEFLRLFADRVRNSRYYASRLYAATLPHRVRAAAVRPIFESMVDLSDDGDLLDRFTTLPAPVMFMYGEQNNTLSYLADLQRCGVELAEISDSAHFPMYSNAPEMWRRIENFVVAQSDK